MRSSHSSEARNSNVARAPPGRLRRRQPRPAAARRLPGSQPGARPVGRRSRRVSHPVWHQAHPPRDRRLTDARKHLDRARGVRPAARLPHPLTKHRLDPRHHQPRRQPAQHHDLDATNPGALPRRDREHPRRPRPAPRRAGVGAAHAHPRARHPAVAGAHRPASLGAMTRSQLPTSRLRADWLTPPAAVGQARERTPAESPSGLERLLATADIFGRLRASAPSAWSVILTLSNARRPGTRAAGAAVGTGC